MLFMNIARRFGAVYSEEAGTETGSPVTAAPVEAAKPAVEVAQAVVETAPVEAAPVDAVAAQEAFSAEYAVDKPALAVALGFLGRAGISPTDPAFVAAQGGDFNLLKAVLAEKGLQGSDQMVAILEGEVAASVEAQVAHEAATTAIVTEVLGEGHAEILSWARENALPEEKEAINAMLANGGVYARAAAVLLNQAWNAGDTTKAAEVAVTTSAPSVGSNTPLSARDYSDAVAALAKSTNGDPRGTPAYAALSQRRAAGRARGI